MDVLHLQLKTFWFCGFWHEKRNLSFFQSLYKFFMIIMVYQICIFQILGTFLKNNEIEILINDLGLTLTILALIIKFHNFLARQDEILDILNDLRSDIFKPVNLEETTILKKYQRHINQIFLIFLILCVICTVTILISPLIFNKPENFHLPLKVYYPFDTVHSPIFGVIYTMQVLQSLFSVIVHVVLDIFFIGQLYLASGQFELLSYRLQKACDEGRKQFSKELKNLVEHHLKILELIRKSQSFNMGVIMICISLSLLILCSSIFQIAKPLSALDSHSVFAIPYFGSMILQAFLYCRYGHYLDMKSKLMANAIYESNWLSLEPSERRSLLFMHMISEKGLVISYHGICVLNHETFRWLLKTSYASVNILKQVIYR